MNSYIKLVLSTLFGMVLTLVTIVDAPAATQSLKQQILGTWNYVSVETAKSDGSRVYPLGDRLNGVAIFERDGHYVIVITAVNQPKYASNNRLMGTAEENQATVRGSISQFGTYTVNEADHSLTIHAVGSSYPNIIGVDRKFIVTSITKNELKWTVPQASSGGAVHSVLKRGM